MQETSSTGTELGVVCIRAIGVLHQNQGATPSFWCTSSNSREHRRSRRAQTTSNRPLLAIATVRARASVSSVVAST